MSNIVEPTSIGLSEKCHQYLKSLKENNNFEEMVDAYRLGIALALANKISPPEVSQPRQTIFGISTVDPKGEIFTVISVLCPDIDSSIYRHAEKLAEWGVNKLYSLSMNGDINFSELLDEATAGSENASS